MENEPGGNDSSDRKFSHSGIYHFISIRNVVLMCLGSLITLAVMGVVIRTGVLLDKKYLDPKLHIQLEDQGVQSGIGWSARGNAGEAVEEALAVLRGKLKKNPDYILAYYTPRYNVYEIHEELARRVGLKTQIQGSISREGVLTSDGYHKGEKGAIALMGIVFENIWIGVGGADMDVLSPREAGKRAIEMALANSSSKDLPQIIFLASSPGNEEGVIAGIEDVIGRQIPIVGASAGEAPDSVKNGLIANDAVFKNGVSVAAIFTDLKIGRAHEFGYSQTLKSGIATKAAGRTLFEIDNQPAAKVYSQWTGSFSGILARGGSIEAEAALYPLGRVLKGPEVTYLCLSHPSTINSDHSIYMKTEIRQGEEIELLHGSWEWLINRGRSVAKKAMMSGNIKKNEGLFAFYTMYAPILTAIPESERSKLPILIATELGNVPFIGSFSGGEQVDLPGLGNTHANFINSITIFK